MENAGGAKVMPLKDLLSPKISLGKDNDGLEEVVIGDADTSKQNLADAEAKAAEEAKKAEDAKKAEEAGEGEGEGGKKAEEAGEGEGEGGKETMNIIDEFLPGDKDKPKDEPKDTPPEDIKDGPKDVDTPPENMPDGKTSEAYVSSLKTLFGDDFSIIQPDEEGNDVEVKVDDLILNQENYTNIVENIYKQKEKELKDSYIAKDSISDFTADIIEIEKLGGNVTEVLNAKKNITDVLNSLDLTNKEHQKEAIRLRHSTKGKSEDEINRLIRTYELDDELKSYAEAADEELRDAVKQHTQSVKDKAKEYKKIQEKKFEEYKDNIGQELSKLEISDAARRKIKKAAVAKDKEGKFELDKQYFEATKDPEMAIKLAMLLNNEDLFVKLITNKKVQEAKLQSAPSYRIPVRSSNSSVKTKHRNEIGPDRTMNLREFE